MSIDDKPSVFVGSSTESISIAEAVQENLQHTCNIELWSQGTFQPSSTSLDDLLKTINRFDFAIFIFKPDDVTKLRDKEYSTVRDNLIFEMGMFIGKIGKERTFYITPRDTEIHLPTDLIGFSPATYNKDQSNIIAAVGAACSAIKRKITELGKIV
ncbi:nucleotide-binding protein [Clostridium sp. YIM B02551]|uniref:nucleotide-binding protein n=1 Tax=Clostridium sp. YIM B02551 TaxID=2910679 RepID=UPI001EEA40AB|nr:nucleotide-binding protein [Clostridium sp. YIM B02551]